MQLDIRTRAELLKSYVPKYIEEEEAKCFFKIGDISGPEEFIHLLIDRDPLYVIMHSVHKEYMEELADLLNKGNDATNAH
jgi:hypothetical protein